MAYMRSVLFRRSRVESIYWVFEDAGIKGRH